MEAPALLPTLTLAADEATAFGPSRLGPGHLFIAASRLWSWSSNRWPFGLEEATS